ncbi:hypothetical protein TNCV_2713551 [Trichonephila clavipes]|nr:hypothetical protein TNCV_2713551 [Trichonephila clavipes]
MVSVSITIGLEQDWAYAYYSQMRVSSVSSSDCRRQLIWRESGTAAYRPENIQEKEQISDMQYHGVGRHHDHWPHRACMVIANGTMTGQRYIDEVLLPHVRLFRELLLVINLFLWIDNATCMHRTLACSGLSRQRGYSTLRMCQRVLQI